MENPIYSGFFTSTGAAYQINFRPGVNWMWVYNYTATAQAAADLAAKFYWQSGMPQGGGIIYTKLGAVANDPLTMGVLTAPNGFTTFDNSIVTVGAANALTAITAANPPVVTTAATLPTVGSIVRFSTLTSAAGVGNGQRQIDGIDFTVTAAGGGTFTIGNISLVNSTASTAGFWRLISSDPQFYPRTRTITWITASSLGTVPAGSTRIYTSVTHGYVVGQKINLQLPGGTAVWGNFAALNNVVVTITAVNTARNGNEPNNGGTANNFDVAYDTAGFGVWNVFGAAANESYLPNTAYPQGPAICIPFGEDSAYAVAAVPPANVLADSLDNVSSVGIILAGGAASPGGAAADLMYWVAGSSFDTIPQATNPTTP